jgi:F-type H+-transporting ATPase subunit b
MTKPTLILAMAIALLGAGAANAAATKAPAAHDAAAHGAAAHGAAAHGAAAHGAAAHGAEDATVEHGEAHGVHEDPTRTFNWTSFSYKGKDLHGGTFDTTEDPSDEAMSPPFIAMVFNFALLVGLLVWKLRSPARQFAEKRHNEIKSALDEAAKLRAEAQRQVEEYSRKVAEAEGEVEKLLSDIRADALAEKQRIIAAAEQQAEVLKRDADQRIAAEIERARRELEHDVVLAAIGIAEKLLREKTSTADHNKLIEGFLGDVAREPRAGEERT